jgi:hypothetical protein
MIKSEFRRSDHFNAAVLKLGVATLFRVAKYFLRVAKVHDCPIALDSPQIQHQNRPSPRPTYSLYFLAF